MSFGISLNLVRIVFVCVLSCDVGVIGSCMFGGWIRVGSFCWWVGLIY